MTFLAPTMLSVLTYWKSLRIQPKAHLELGLTSSPIDNDDEKPKRSESEHGNGSNNEKRKTLITFPIPQPTN
ncbi:hypothetical protein VNO77_22353 [Canavalia gladiata]|uniref:Uncharacterized protein n=1 Tax=Canavalia gladiata TaxID=3824 RepID=A0AAN9Q7Y0_CANGL